MCAGVFILLWSVSLLYEEEEMPPAKAVSQSLHMASLSICEDRKTAIDFGDSLSSTYFWIFMVQALYDGTQHLTKLILSLIWTETSVPLD